MKDASSVGIQGMGLRWRIVSLLIIAALQVILVWTAIHFILRWDSWRFLVLALLTAVLVSTGYDIAKSGKPSRISFFFLFCFFLGTFVRDVHRFWNHDPNVDLFFTLFAEVFYIFITLVWIWKNPFGVRKIDPVTIKGNFT